MSADTSFLTIKLISDGKMRFLPLLLMGDESEKMIARYLGRGSLYAAFCGDTAVAVCVATDEGPRTVEVRNLAVAPDFRCRGIGRAMLRHIENINPACDIILGTGATPSTLRFYRSCGYNETHRIPDFFTDNYDAPIIEEGVLLRDMIYLRKPAAAAQQGV